MSELIDEFIRFHLLNDDPEFSELTSTLMKSCLMKTVFLMLVVMFSLVSIENIADTIKYLLQFLSADRRVD